MPYLRLNDKHTCSNRSFSCGKEKPVIEFYIDKRKSKEGLVYVGNRCKKCVAKNTVISRERIYGSNGLSRRYHRYGIASNHIEELKKHYSDICPLCRKRPLQVIDHCHNTGLVRGMLCSPCNNALGVIGDDGSAVDRLIEYFSDTKIPKILALHAEFGPNVDRTSSPGEKTLREMYFDRKMSFKDIAAELNVTIGTISSWFSKHSITPRRNADGVKLAWKKDKFNAIC